MLASDTRQAAQAPLAEALRLSGATPSAAEHNVYQFPSKAAFDACDFTAASVISDGLNQTNTADYAVQTTSYFACEVRRAPKSQVTHRPPCVCL